MRQSSGPPGVTMPTGVPEVPPSLERRTQAQAARTALEGSPARSTKQATNKWSRWLHVYASMISFVILVFFGLTGITLNHPSWTFGSEVVRSDLTGELPAESYDENGDLEFLMVSEFLRSSEGIKGEVIGFDSEGTGGTITYRSPGYSAQATFDSSTGAYEVAIEQQGWLAVMNELHKGRDANSPWRWLVDVSGGFLVLVGLSGLVIQFVMRKRRTRALLSVVAGGMVSLALGWWALV